MKYLSYIAASLAIGTAIFASTACGDDDTATGPTTTNPEGGNASSSSSSGGSSINGLDTAALGTAVCNFYQKCASSYLISVYGDAAGCNAAFTASFENDAALPGESVTQSQLDACTAAYGTLSCDAESDIPACQFVGTLADGASCSTDLQCSGGACVLADSKGATSSCGKCATRLKENETCGQENQAECAAGLSCTNDRCTKLLAANATCDDTTAPCDTGLKCITGTCQTAHTTGQACTQEGDECAVTFECGPLNTCVAATAPTVVEVGGACKGDGTDVCKASYCSSTSKTCTAFAKVGEACSDSIQCNPDTLDCNGTVCIATDTATCP